MRFQVDLAVVQPLLFQPVAGGRLIFHCQNYFHVLFFFLLTWNCCHNKTIHLINTFVLSLSKADRVALKNTKTFIQSWLENLLIKITCPSCWLFRYLAITIAGQGNCTGDRRSLSGIWAWTTQGLEDILVHIHSFPFVFSILYFQCKSTPSHHANWAAALENFPAEFISFASTGLTSSAMCLVLC